MRCLIFPLSLLILMAAALQAEAASNRALRAEDSQTTVAKWLQRVSEHMHRRLPPMSHDWAFEGDDKQTASPSPAPTRAPTPAPVPADKDAAVVVAAAKEQAEPVSSMALLHEDDPIKEETATALSRDINKAPTDASKLLLQGGVSPSSAIGMHGWNRNQYSKTEQPNTKDQQHRVLPPMSHGWANEAPGAGIVPGIGFKDEVGQAHVEEEGATQESLPGGGEIVGKEQP